MGEQSDRGLSVGADGLLGGLVAMLLAVVASLFMPTPGFGLGTVSAAILLVVFPIVYHVGGVLLQPRLIASRCSASS